MTIHFAMEHDEQIWRCFSTLLGVNPEAPDAHVKASHFTPIGHGRFGVEKRFQIAERRTLGKLG